MRNHLEKSSVAQSLDGKDRLKGSLRFPIAKATASVCGSQSLFLQLGDGHFAVDAVDRDLDLVPGLYRIEQQAVLDFVIRGRSPGAAAHGAALVLFQRDGAGRLVDFRDLALEGRFLGVGSRAKRKCDGCRNHDRSGPHEDLPELTLWPSTRTCPQSSRRRRPEPERRRRYSTCIPLAFITAAAARLLRNPRNAVTASGGSAPAGVPAMKVVVFWNSSGNGPTSSAPAFSAISLICVRP